MAVAYAAVLDSESNFRCLHPPASFAVRPEANGAQ
jgi:hypothetical protein